MLNNAVVINTVVINTVVIKSASKLKIRGDNYPDTGGWCPLPPEAVCINPVALVDDGTLDADQVNFPALTAAGYIKQRLSLK